MLVDISVYTVIKKQKMKFGLNFFWRKNYVKGKNSCIRSDGKYRGL